MTTSRQFMLETGCTYGEALKKVADERAANKAAKIARVAAVVNSPIAVAVAPLKDDAVASAEKWAAAKIEFVKKELEAVGWDREIAAPYPRAFNMSRVDFMTKQARYQLFHAFTKGEPSHRRGTPDICVIDDERAAHFINQAKEAAAAQYEAFVEKLVYKIGETSAASLDGNHVWSHSILTVTKPNGAVEKWKTQQITNVSKLGKYFPQWPSRKVK